MSKPVILTKIYVSEILASNVNVCHGWMIQKMYQPFYRTFYLNVSLWDKGRASHDALVTRFGHFENWLEVPASNIS